MPENQKSWNQWKQNWTAVFNEKKDIHKLANSGDFNNKSNSANETSMSEQTVASIDNLENAAVQKNDTVEKLIL